MISPQLKELIRPFVLVQRLVWIIITGSILFYSFLACMLLGSNLSGGVRSITVVENVFYVAAVVLAVSSVLYQRYSLSDKCLLRVLKRDIDDDALSGAMGTKSADAGQLSRLKSLSDFDKRAFSLMYELQKISFINLILNEMVIMIGFVIAFLSNYYLKIIPFGIVSLLLNIWMFPRPEAILEKAQNLFRA